MKNWLFFCAFVLIVSWAYGEEFYVQKNQSDLIIEGRFLNEQSNKGKQFWICVDYTSSIEVPEGFGNKYPITFCGGSPRTRDNMFWYAVHGIYEQDDKLSIRFKSSFQLWPEMGNDVRLMGSFLWTGNALTNSDGHFKIIQSHGVTNYDAKREDVDTLLLSGSGSVHVRGVKDGSKIHVRVKSEDETGMSIEKIYEAKYNKQTGAIETESPSLISSEELITESPFYRDIDFSNTKSDSTPEIEEVTTKIGLTKPDELPRLIDSEPFEVVHTNDEDAQTSTTTTEESPRLLVLVPQMDEDGTQERPKENIPFVDKSTLTVDPVYDRSSEEARQSELIKFENEIAEEETTSTTTQATVTEVFSDEDNLQKAINDANSLMSNQETPLSDLLIQEQDVRGNYQMLQTVAIGIALSFFCFFIAIVLFRCFAWGNAVDKVNSHPPQTQEKHVVYTIGGADTLPIKVMP